MVVSRKQEVALDKKRDAVVTDARAKAMIAGV